MVNEIIEKIYEIQDELFSLGVEREDISLEKFDDDRLADELEALRDQLARRKKFLGTNYQPKTEIAVKADHSERRSKFFENLCR